MAVNRKSDIATCGGEPRQRRGRTAEFADGSRSCSADSCFILTEEAGAEALEFQFSRARGIIVITPSSGYAVFLPFVLTPS